MLFSTSVAHALEHEKLSDDKVLITYHDFWLLFNMMTTQSVGIFPLICAFFQFWNFYCELTQLHSVYNN